MALSSFGKILTVLDLFSVSRPVINVDLICAELGLPKPTSYRYLKELVSADILQRLSGTSGDYSLGPKIAVLDYISRTTDPLVQISTPFMKEIAERTELCCLLTFLNRDYCIDVHHEVFKDMQLFSYGRGCPRPVFMGASPKVIIANLSKQKILEYYHRYAPQLSEREFAQDEAAFTAQIKNKAIACHMVRLIQRFVACLFPLSFQAKKHRWHLPWWPLEIALILSTSIA